MSRLIELMDIWLNDHADRVNFSHDEFVELTELMTSEQVISATIPEPDPGIEENYAFDTYYQQLLAEKKLLQKEIDLQRSLTIRPRIDWKYYRRNKHLVNIP